MGSGEIPRGGLLVSAVVTAHGLDAKVAGSIPGGGITFFSQNKKYIYI